MNARARKTEQLSFWGHVHTSYGSTGNYNAKQISSITEEKEARAAHPSGCGCWTCPSQTRRRAPAEQLGVPHLRRGSCPGRTVDRAPAGQEIVPQMDRRSCPDG